MAVKAKHVALEKGLNKRPIVVYEGQMLLSLFFFFFLLFLFLLLLFFLFLILLGLYVFHA